MFKCGMSELAITPSLGQSIPGSINDRKSTGVKDELFAKAVVFENEKDVLATVVLDIIGIEEKDVIRVRQRANVQTGIPTSNIMVCATHTHTSGSIAPLYECEREEDYISFMVEKAADAIALAYQKRVDVKVGFGVGEEKDIAFNRRFFMKDGTFRNNPGVKNPLIDRVAGPVDPDVTVMRIDDLNGNSVGVVSNYACHLDCVGGTEYSADYSGEISRTLKKLFGQEFISIFLTGACGNINHIDVTGKLELTPQHYKRMGRILAGEVLKVREKVNCIDNVELGSACKTINMEMRQPGDEDIQKAEAILKEGTEERVEEFWAKELIKFHKLGVKSKNIEVQVMKIGELAVTGLPAEIFVEFGLDIKEKSPFKYNIVSTLTNGLNGYVPTREAFEQGGYEPHLTTYTYLEEEAGYKMVSNTLELMKEL